MDRFNAFLESSRPRSSRRELTRVRLRSAARAEQNRRQRVRFGAKVGVVGLVIFAVWSVAPVTPDRDSVVPLLELADAVEGREPAPDPSSGLRYTRSDRVDLIVVPPELVAGAGVDRFRFLLPSVHESWVGPGDRAQVRITHGEPEFLSSGDSAVFQSLGLASVYSIGQQVEESVPLAMMGPLELPSDDHSTVSDLLRRQVTGLGDRRDDEVTMLRLATDMIRNLDDEPRNHAAVLRAIADIPGIDVRANDATIDVSVDYVDGDRPLRLRYAFDADTAELVGESLAVLATVTEPETVLWRADHESVRLHAEES